MNTTQPPHSPPLTERAQVHLEWPELCARLASLANSEVAAAQLLSLQPEQELSAAIYQGELTQAALIAAGLGASIPSVNTPEVLGQLESLEKARVLSAPELSSLLKLTSQAAELERYAKARAEQQPSLAVALNIPKELSPLRAELERCLDSDGSLSDRASPGLSSARGVVKHRRRELTTRLNRLVNHHADQLAGSYYTERDGRYVLPIRSDSYSQDDGLILGSSGSGATLYVEPKELVGYGNQLRLAEAEVAREEAKVLAKLSGLAQGVVGELFHAYEALLTAERLIAFTRWATRVGGQVLIPKEHDRELRLNSMRHPMLAFDALDVVPNDLRLEVGHALVISGPNAGGKTVALKCLGLAALMARAGVPIPVDDQSKIPFFADIYSDIGDDQSLSLSLSTFSGHIQNIAQMLDGVYETSGRALVLLDELAAGTDPDQGAALASALLYEFVSRGATLAVTTHYEALKQLSAEDSRFQNASVSFDFERMAPTFKLQLGVPGASSALAVAARFGIEAPIINRAEKLLPKYQLERDALLSQLEQQRYSTEKALKEAEQLKLDTIRQQNKLLKEIEHNAERQRAALDREAHELNLQLRQARSDLAQVQARLKQEQLSADELRQLSQTVNGAGQQLSVGSRLDRHTRGEPQGAQPEPEQLKLGLKVYVAPGGQLGEIVELPTGKNIKGSTKLRVRVGALNLLCKLQDLRLPLQAGASAKPAKNYKFFTNLAAQEPKQAPKAKTQQPARPAQTRFSNGMNGAESLSRGSAQPEAGLVRHPEITCDLRGQRVEESLEQIEGFADSLLQRGEPAGFILHGHGTNALKQAVRTYLKSAHFVSQFRVASREEGGDAYTVFWLK